jgi:hypothetical protein
MDLLWFEMDAAADHSAFIDAQIVGGAEGDDLVTDPDAKSREVLSRTFGPLEIDASK